MPGVEVPTWSVGELTAAVRALLAAGFPDEVWVEGEVASLRRGRNGHVWFDLVDTSQHEQTGAHTAMLPVVLFDDVRREVNALLRASGVVRMRDGVQIRVRGRLDLRSTQGRLQLRMSTIDPTYTLGRLVAARDELVRRLTAEGLAERNAALALPALPLHLGVVASHGTAGCTDLLEELRGSGIGFRVSLVDTPVQGERAPRAVAAAVADLGRRGVDAIALVRGGGARTDLVVFDAEVVARAVAASPVPVITGIGHDIDLTVADVVAHTAAKTPTACAGIFVAQVRRTADRADAVAERLPGIAHAALRGAERRHLRRAGWAAGAARVHLRVAAEDLVRREGAVATRARRTPDAALRRIDGLARRSDAHDPARVLARGWSVTRASDGRLVRDPAALDVGDRVETLLAAGTLHSEVVAEDDRTEQAGGTS